ncbi:GxxExxY protein [Patescibacteria group bacterium]
MNKVDNFLYEKQTYLIRKACFRVWNKLGGWHKERIIDKALTIELRNLGLRITDQRSFPIEYRGFSVGSYRPDKIIDDKILVEVKSKQKLTQSDLTQFWRYLKTTHFKLGLLINFGNQLQVIRRVYDTARQNRQQR